MALDSLLNTTDPGVSPNIIEACWYSTVQTYTINRRFPSLIYAPVTCLRVRRSRYKNVITCPTLALGCRRNVENSLRSAEYLNSKDAF